MSSPGLRRFSSACSFRYCWNSTRGLRVLDLLGGRELVLVVDEVDEAADLRLLERLELRHVLERQTKDRRDHPLRERLGELRYQLCPGPVLPALKQRVDLGRIMSAC